MSFEQVIALLSLIGGCIYAAVTITLKVFEFLQKGKN